MFYRRKIILGLLQISEGSLDKISLQKLLFLFSQRQPKPDYEFVPYKYGCYSFSLQADLTAMVSKKLLDETESHYYKIDNLDYIKNLKTDDKKTILQIKELYGRKSSNALMKHTYVNHPYWAINSIVARNILTDTELAEIDYFKHNFEKAPTLFTVGYEGVSLERYLNKLIKNNIHILIDVRNNPLSMKFGFSKGGLQKYCLSLGIQYLHFPEVGIQSEFRQELNNQDDYDKLFEKYCRIHLPKTQQTQELILSFLKEGKRIALTCFEANICQCHRKHLAEAISKLPNFHYKIKHI